MAGVKTFIRYVYGAAYRAKRARNPQHVEVAEVEEVDLPSFARFDDPGALHIQYAQYRRPEFSELILNGVAGKLWAQPHIKRHGQVEFADPGYILGLEEPVASLFGSLKAPTLAQFQADKPGIEWVETNRESARATALKHVRENVAIVAGQLVCSESAPVFNVGRTSLSNVSIHMNHMPRNQGDRGGAVIPMMLTDLGAARAMAESLKPNGRVSVSEELENLRVINANPDYLKTDMTLGLIRSTLSCVRFVPTSSGLWLTKPALKTWLAYREVADAFDPNEFDPAVLRAHFGEIAIHLPEFELATLTFNRAFDLKLLDFRPRIAAASDPELDSLSL
ncbi:conserved hypothetical protein [Hyphomicrobiales bacterium]|jgi:hypothetical protein|nr:conserved hypothetical protein [Hyphomicrobiales bacterium]CAH1702703.1 hypothetical protein BOSEA1005_30575 [Hyphomicrobiales bacterium]CAI0346893.1 conserved hypothetical protein [Hyphomicrobiales bacterium]